MISATRLFICVSLLGFGTLLRAEDVSPVKAKWDSLCAKCHGADGSASSALAKKLKVKSYKDPATIANLSDDELKAAILNGVTKDGKEKMKGYSADVTEAEALEMVKLIKSFSGK